MDVGAGCRARASRSHRKLAAVAEAVSAPGSLSWSLCCNDGDSSYFWTFLCICQVDISQYDTNACIRELTDPPRFS